MLQDFDKASARHFQFSLLRDLHLDVGYDHGKFGHHFRCAREEFFELRVLSITELNSRGFDPIFPQDFESFRGEIHMLGVQESGYWTWLSLFWGFAQGAGNNQEGKTCQHLQRVEGGRWDPAVASRRSQRPYAENYLQRAALWPGRCCRADGFLRRAFLPGRGDRSNLSSIDRGPDIKGDVAQKLAQTPSLLSILGRAGKRDVTAGVEGAGGAGVYYIQLGRWGSRGLGKQSFEACLANVLVEAHFHLVQVLCKTGVMALSALVRRGWSSDVTMQAPGKERDK